MLELQIRLRTMMQPRTRTTRKHHIGWKQPVRYQRKRPLGLAEGPVLGRVAGLLVSFPKHWQLREYLAQDHRWPDSLESLFVPYFQYCCLGAERRLACWQHRRFPYLELHEFG